MKKTTIISLPNQKTERKRINKTNIFEEFSLDDSFFTLGKDKLYYIYTYGCQENEADSEKIMGMLNHMSYKRTMDVEKADVIVMNTCAIRKNAEDKVFGEIGRLKPLKRRNPNLITIICGCMSQEEVVVETILKKYQNVDIVVGTHNIHDIPLMLKRIYEGHTRIVNVLSHEGTIVESIPVIRESKIAAWVPIMYGCDEFCSYCIVPYTRGKERSRLPENIINEVKKLKEEGYKQVTLLGQNVNAYGKDFIDIKYDFADLLTDLHKIDIERIRFTTSNPKDFDSRQVDAMALGGNIMPQLHLPVQSGSNKVLRAMARRYTKEKYLDLVKEIKAKIPNVSLTTDIIVGFPGETDEDFNETLDLVKKVEYEGAFTFIFSPREGTPAAKLSDPLITDEIAHERLYKLNELVNEGYLKGNMRFLNTIQDVLIEGISKNNPDVLMGYNPNGKLVNVKGDKSLIGQIIKVKITDAKSWSLDGEAI